MSFTPITKTGSDVARVVKRQFGDEAGVQITNSDILDWINEAQRRIANKNKVIKARAVTNVIKGQSEYELPSMDINQITGISINGKFLRAIEFPSAVETVIAADPGKGTSGEPECWYEYGGKITLWPVPDEDLPDSLRVYYVKNPSEVHSLTDTLSLPDKYFDKVVDLVLASAYELDENFAAASYKEAQVRDDLDEINTEEYTSSHMTYPTITTYEEY